MPLPKLSPAAQDAIALLAGLALPLAFAPFGYAAVAVLSPMLLFATWLNATPGRAFRRGYLFGLGQFGAGVSWVYVSMHQYGGAGVAESSGLTALFAAFLALYPALAGWLSLRFFPAAPAMRLLLIVPAVWTLSEWVRGWFLSGFTWLQLGYSQTDTPLAALGPVLGVYGMSWAVALVAGGLLALMQLPAPSRRALAVLLTLGLGGCALLGRVEWTQGAGEPFRVALLQGNIPQDLKWQPEQQRETLRHYLDLTRKNWDARLIVWPETAIPAFYHQIKDTVLPPLSEEAGRHGTDLLIGIPFYRQDADQYLNALVGVGNTQGTYYKRHLVPFGEYLPVRPLLGWVLEVLQIPLADFVAGGNEQEPMVAAGHPLAASICYEDIFGEESRLGLPAAAYLVNVTNDAWFGDSMAPHQHAQMARVRALEAGRYLLRATNTGVTAIIGPKGEMLAQAPLFERTSLTGKIKPLAGATPYVRWGDGPLIIGLIFVLGFFRVKAARENCLRDH